MRPPARLLKLIAPAALLLNGACLSLDAEVPDLCVTRTDIAIQGVGAFAAMRTASVDESFTADHAAIDLPNGTSADLRAKRVTFKAHGVPDLSFIEGLKISVRPAGSTTAPAQVIDYQQAPGTVVTDELQLPVTDSGNLYDTLRSAQAQFDLGVTGQLPANDWSVDVTVCFAGRLTGQAGL